MNSKMEMTEIFNAKEQSGGFCHRCQEEHMLPAGGARDLAQKLMERLEHHERLDFNSSQAKNPLFSTSSLFGEDRGKMFGVLEGVDKCGHRVALYAFSGQFNGHWLIPGWAPPLFDERRWQEQNYATEKRIKILTAQINTIANDVEEKRRLKRQRKLLSQELMSKLHALYTVKNFRGETAPLPPFYTSLRGAPTGAGDCCAPKLLHHACERMITPTGMAEFYWGRTNPSESREHGHFYPACVSKCKPLLGFMLCGLKQHQRALELYL